ncbi:MAG: phage protease [Prosthecobacter sp.]|uniref:phage protease n=1 Tax=Prosthecobacter sp. TaxID=1965333 RepID=UPI003BB17DFD
MSKETSLLNHASAPFDSSKSCWAHVCPFGEHPWVSEDGKETIVQVIDREAVEAMARTYPVGTPSSRVDVDHKSMSIENTTEASGWGKEVQIRDDGLWVRIELTAFGQPLVNGKVYQFTSPCFPREGLVDLGNGRMRVTKLGVIALTNDPNLRGQKPLTNRRSESANPNTKPANTMDYKAMLLKLLGLPPEATDEQISAACASSPENMKQCANRIGELEGLLANRDLDEHGITDSEQRKLLTPSLTNKATRPAALAILAKGKVATTEPRQPLHNRNGGKTPGTITELSQDDKANVEAEAKKAAWIGNRARELSQGGRRKHQDCFAQAQSEYDAKN